MDYVGKAIEQRTHAKDSTPIYPSRIDYLPVGCNSQKKGMSSDSSPLKYGEDHLCLHTIISWLLLSKTVTWRSEIALLYSALLLEGWSFPPLSPSHVGRSVAVKGPYPEGRGGQEAGSSMVFGGAVRGVP